MKCDKLEKNVIEDFGCKIEWYEADKVDTAIAELKAEITRLERVRKVHIEGIESMAEGLKLDAEQLRKTQRALWLARGYIMNLLHRDFQRLAYGCNNDDYKKNLLRRRNRYYDLYEKCRAKAKEFV